MPNIISIVGKSGSGKTTFIEKLVPVLKSRGYRVGTIKHTHHRIDMDKKGKDSWRHRQAGADATILASPNAVAILKNEECDSLDNLEHHLRDMDIILTEGYKRENRPKIEIIRAATNKGPIFEKSGNPSNLIAAVTDLGLETDVPVFGLEEVEKLADFLESRYL